MIPTRHDNPCLICGDTKGKCRHTEIGVLCMTFPDGGNTPGWRYNGRTKDGLWGQYSEGRNLSVSEQIEWEQRKRDREAKALKVLQDRYKSALSIPERDKAIRAIAASHGLKPQHRADLHRRGLDDDAIASLLFFSVVDGKELPPGVPRNLPGTKDGKIATSASGYACVLFDNQGRAIGWQIRTSQQSGNKYLWAKDSHLKCSELPLTVAVPPEIKRNTLGLAEGVLKPQIAARRLSQQIIGAAGGQFLASYRQLAFYLDGVDAIDLYPDAGDLLNPQVLQRWIRLIEWLEHKQIAVNIGWWGQFTKDCSDVDELTDTSVIKYISTREWLRLANQKPKRDRGSFVALQLQRMKETKKG